MNELTGALSVAGSDTMKPLTESWSAKLRQLYPGLSIKLDSRGSETGLDALLEGKAQIAAMSRRMTQQEVVEFKREFGYEPTEVPVAVDALAVFVHKDNPIEGLTLAEVDAVFSKNGDADWNILSTCGATSCCLRKSGRRRLFASTDGMEIPVRLPSSESMC